MFLHDSPVVAVKFLLCDVVKHLLPAWLGIKKSLSLFLHFILWQTSFIFAACNRDFLGFWF